MKIDHELIRDFLFYIEEQPGLCKDFDDVFLKKIKQGDYDECFIKTDTAAIKNSKILFPDKTKTEDELAMILTKNIEKQIKNQADIDAKTYFGYQMKLIEQEGFTMPDTFVIEQWNGYHHSYHYHAINGLSLAGQNHLSSIREKEIWNQLKNKAKNLSLDAICQIGTKLTKNVISKQLEKVGLKL